jgi:hypothetical protein
MRQRDEELAVRLEEAPDLRIGHLTGLLLINVAPAMQPVLDGIRGAGLL